MLTRDAGLSVSTRPSRDVAAVVRGDDGNQAKHGRTPQSKAILSACCRGKLLTNTGWAARAGSATICWSRCANTRMTKLKSPALPNLCASECLQMRGASYRRQKSQGPYLVLEGRSMSPVNDIPNSISRGFQRLTACR